MGKDHELLEAARSGNVTVVDRILQQKGKRSGPLASLRRGPGANVQDSSGYSGLHHAALNGHADVVRILLKYDASPNLPDCRGSSPLHLAAWAGHQDICTILLSHPNRPANSNLQTVDNETPLHCAAQHGHTGALTTLLAHGADPNVPNSRGETPLELAAQYGRLQAVQMLICAHPELLLPFKYERTVQHSPLHLASRNGHKNVVEVLLAAGVNVNLLTESGTALHEAALCGKDSVVRALLDAGANLEAMDRNHKTALDLLEQFPPHVTKGIVSVINNHRNSMIYDDSDAENSIRYTSAQQPMSLGSSYENNRISPNHHRHAHHGHHQRGHHYWSSQTDGTSPSSSMGSLGGGGGGGGGPPSPSPPRPRASTADTTMTTPGCYVSMAPINSSKVSPTPPKKPPRRNLSVSPTHLQSTQHTLQLMSQSMDNSEFNSHQKLRHGSAAYEYLFLAHSGTKSYSDLDSDGGGGGGSGGKPFRIYRQPHQSADEYVVMSPTHGGSRAPNYTGDSQTHQLRVYNPNRKLRRNRDNYENFNIDRGTAATIPRNHSNDYQINTATTTAPATVTPPMSPSHYKQPPTPEHPPPTALQAEKCIHERIRPLSQEYKRRSAILRAGGNATAWHDEQQLCQSLGASSGSLSSSVSASDRSAASTDCVEEYIGDVPFAGLFKGSTITLDKPVSYYQKVSAGITVTRPERPKTLRTTASVPASPVTTTDLNEKQVTADVAVLSPFDELEEWAKISEIMATFGTGFLKDSIFNNELNEKPDANNRLNRSRIRGSKSTLARSPLDHPASLIADHNQTAALADWLYENELEHLESTLTSNGFDNLDFLNGILDKEDFTILKIPTETDQLRLLQEVTKLPKPAQLTNTALLNNISSSSGSGSGNNNNLQNNNNDGPVSGILTVEQWLKSIKLDEYIDVFTKHFYTEMMRVCRIWEVELQAVLEINKLGHRKRILYSVAVIADANEPTISAGQVASCKQLQSNATTNNLNEVNDAVALTTNILNDEPQQRIPAAAALATTTNGHRTNYGKNRPAPKPPTSSASSAQSVALQQRAANLEIRGPSELLLGFPTGLIKTQWRHTAQTLVSGSVRYEVNYLGSTIVKELRGTESTRKSIQKLKRGERINGGGHGGVPALNCSAANNGIGGHGAAANSKRPVCLSISHRGVQFIDVLTQGTICEHESRNIDCACQDADDLSHFAYITKDLDHNTHYCHVFNVESMDLATEVILTLGQAFEVAYQLAIRDQRTPTTPLRSPSNSMAGGENTVTKAILPTAI